MFVSFVTDLDVTKTPLQEGAKGQLLGSIGNGRGQGLQFAAPENHAFWYKVDSVRILLFTQQDGFAFVKFWFWNESLELM